MTDTPSLVERKECPVCLSKEFNTLYECAYDQDPIKSLLERHFGRQGEYDSAPLKGHIFRVDECKSCTLLFQRFVPNGPMLGLIYSKFLGQEREANRFPKKERLRRYRRRAMQLLNLVEAVDGPVEEMRFLDFGMGWAHASKIMVSLGCQVSGVEVSDAKIQHAKAHGIKVLTREEALGETFNIIYTDQVFEHLVDPRQELIHLSRALAPGGIMMVSVPPGRNVKSALNDETIDKSFRRRGVRDQAVGAIMPLGHISCFNTKSLTALGAEAGLAPINLPSNNLCIGFARHDWKDSLKAIIRPISHRLIRDMNLVYFKRVET